MYPLILAAGIAALLAGGLLAVTAGATGSPPAFVQQVTAHSGATTALTLTPGAAITTGNRLVVGVGVWSGAGAGAAGVTDSAGDGFTELLHFRASDQTELSVWSAPITAGGGARPTITVKPTSKADVGAVVSEYSGLLTAGGSGAVDQIAKASGTTGGAATVSSGPTAPTTAPGEIAVGMYTDSGFGDTLGPGAGWTQRANASKNSNIELLSEDQSLPAVGAAPSATVSTGGGTVWLMATVVFAPPTADATAPAVPTGVTATPGDGSATVSWTAPSDGGSQITSYTVTPYVGPTAQPATTVTGAPPWPNATITGLTDGTTYTFTVSATNAIGTSSPSSPSDPVTPTSTAGGQWSAQMSWPMVAIHSVLLDTGRVLQWDGWQQPEPTQVWDPSTQTFTTQTAPDSIFCSGMAELPDGRVLVVGGFGGLSTGDLGIKDTSIFDPATSTWTRVANMHYARWYPDLTELADGDYVAISGNSTDSNHWSETPEVYDPTANTWTTLPGVNTSQVHEEEYPFSYLVPNGDVFTIGPSEDESFLLNVQNQTWTPVGGSSGITNGSSVMYRPGQILYTGGTPTQDSSSPASATAATIDLTAATPAWRPAAPMQYARVYHALTMLADGTVLAVGGEHTWGQTGSTEVSGGVLPSEIWNPATQAWSPAAPVATTRGYHSTAVLMPDGTVLVSGSGHANPG
ncbi:MAG: fibronectin type III domain-containing protein, partial [Mycobacteriales bacterium]